MSNCVSEVIRLNIVAYGTVRDGTEPRMTPQTRPVTRAPGDLDCAAVTRL